MGGPEQAQQLTFLGQVSKPLLPRDCLSRAYLSKGPMIEDSFDAKISLTVFAQALS